MLYMTVGLHSYFRRLICVLRKGRRFFYVDEGGKLPVSLRHRVSASLTDLRKPHRAGNSGVDLVGTQRLIAREMPHKAPTFGIFPLHVQFTIFSRLVANLYEIALISRDCHCLICL